MPTPRTIRFHHRRAAAVLAAAGLAVSLMTPPTHAGSPGGTVRSYNGACPGSGLMLSVPTLWLPVGLPAIDDTLQFSACAQVGFSSLGSVSSLTRLVISGPNQVDMVIGNETLGLTGDLSASLDMKGSSGTPARLNLSGNGSANSFVDIIWAELGNNAGNQPGAITADDLTLSIGELDVRSNSSVTVAAGAVLNSGFVGDLGGGPVVLDTTVNGTIHVQKGAEWQALTDVTLPGGSIPPQGNLVLDGQVDLGDLLINGASRIEIGQTANVEVGRLQVSSSDLEPAIINIVGFGASFLSGNTPLDETISDLVEITVSDSASWNTGSDLVVNAPASVLVTSSAQLAVGADLTLSGSNTLMPLTIDGGAGVVGSTLTLSGTTLDVRNAGSLAVTGGPIVFSGPSPSLLSVRFAGSSLSTALPTTVNGSNQVIINNTATWLDNGGLLQVIERGQIAIRGGARLDKPTGAMVVNTTFTPDVGLEVRGGGTLDATAGSLTIQNGTVEVFGGGALAARGIVVGDGIGGNLTAVLSSTASGSISTVGGLTGPLLVRFDGVANLDGAGVDLAVEGASNLDGGDVVLTNGAIWSLADGGITLTGGALLSVSASSVAVSPAPLTVGSRSTVLIQNGSSVTVGSLQMASSPAPSPQSFLDVNESGGSLFVLDPAAESVIGTNARLRVDSADSTAQFAHTLRVTSTGIFEGFDDTFIAGDLVIGDQATVDLVALNVDGFFNLDEVNLRGELRFVNESGGAGFNVSVNGPVRVAPEGVVRLENYAGQSPLIRADFGYDLGGTLVVERAPGWNPAVEQEITLFQTGVPVNGRFGVALLPGFPDDRALEVRYPEVSPGVTGPQPAVTLGVTTVGRLLGITPAATTPVAGLPVSAAAGDLNGDSFIDLAIVVPDVNPSLPGSIFVLFNDGVSGGVWQGFGSSIQITTGANPRAVTLGNFNLDTPGPGASALDIAVACGGDDTIRIYENSGTGSFAEASGSPIAVGDNPADVEAADFNKDGRDDLLVTNEGDDSFQILLNSATPLELVVGFVVGPQQPVDDMPTDCDPVDLDNDKDLDVAGVAFGGSTVFTSDNDGAGGFGFATGSAGTGNGPVQIAAGDLDGDGDIDLVTADRLGGTVTVLGNSGAPDFNLVGQGAIPVGSDTRSVAIVNIDGDDDLDIAVVSNNAEGTERIIRILRNDTAPGGLFTFAQTTTLGQGSGPVFVLNGDVNNDGRPDLISVDSGSTTTLNLGSAADGSVSVFLNVSTPPVACAGDGNADGVVNGSDLKLVLGQWGTQRPPLTGGNLNGDTTVNSADLNLLLSTFGNTCGPRNR